MNLEQLHSAGFDRSYASESEEGYNVVRCSGCAACVINGTACHERGCPNEVREPPEAHCGAPDEEDEDD